MVAKLSTDQKGAAAEAAITYAAIKLGIGVHRPLFEGGRYDLIFDLGDRLERVQCKWAPLDGQVVAIRPYSCRRAAEGQRKRGYAENEIDGVAAFCPDLDRCFYVPARLVVNRRALSLRVSPCRNNQARRVNWAADYALERLESEVLGP